ncbi:hypothetical protein [Nocardia sp. FBN12]|uniref:WXG100-like domain-containing protein n=1 Tax=Nocardia sp. FBN12 TaxID=3419766 RepID=UPI003CFCD099
MEWPEGNEDEMWAMAEDWRTAADGLRGLVDDVDAAKAAAFKAYPQGEGVEDMLKAFEGMARGDQSVTKLAELFDVLGDSVYQTGTEIEYTKIMFLSSLGLLALEIAAAWVFPPTAPAVQAAAVGVTRVIARGIFGRVLAAILRHGAKATITRVLKFIGQHVAIDTALGTLQELGVQQWQVDQGHRKEVDWNQVKAAAVSSAAGGLAAGPFGNFLGKKLGDGMAPWLKGAITGTGAGLVGAGGGMLGQFGYEGFTQGWDKAWDNLQTAASDPLMWSAGASNGGLSGLNKAGANSAWSAMKPGLFDRPSFSSQIREAMGPGYDLGTFGLSDTAGGDGSSNRPGGEGENRAGADDEATGAGGDDGVRAGAGDDTMGDEGSGESRAGAGDDSQSMRPAGSTQSPEGDAQGPTNSEEGRANQQSGDDQQTAGDGGAGAGRQESKPEVHGGESQVGDGGRQDGGGRAEGESPAAQSDSGQDKSRAGEAEQADGASVGEGTRTDAQSSGQPVTQVNDTQTTNRDTTTHAGAPVGAGMAAAGPVATAGPSPAATGQAPVTNQAATPATGQPAASPTQSPTAPTQSTSTQQSTPGQQSTPAQGSQPAARPGAPEVRAGLTDGAQPGSDIRSGAPEVRTDSPTVDESGVADSQGTAEDPGAPTNRPDEGRAGVGEQRGAGLADTPLQGLRAAPGEAPPMQSGESEVTAEPVRSRDSEVRSEADPLADIAPVVPIVGADPGANPARSGPETSRPGRAGADDTASPRDRTDAGDDRRQPQADEDSGPVYDTRLPNGQGVVHHPTGTAIGEDARTHRVSENVRNDGSHDVVVHGRRDGSVTPSNGDPVHPRDIVDAIRSNPNYVPGTPIRLLACHAGNSNGWAQYVADQLGVDVTAPTDRVGVRREPGSDPVIDRGGDWRTFSPESATTPSDTPSPRTDSDPSDTRDPLDGDGPPLDRDLVDFMSDQDPPPTRPAAMSFLDPVVGTDGTPFNRAPEVDAHLLGVLDTNDPLVRTAGDPPRITHVDGEPIDDFSRRLSAERGDAFVVAATPDAALVAENEQHKAKQTALEVQKATTGRAVRDAIIALKDAENARKLGAEDGEEQIRRAQADVATAKAEAAAAKAALDNFIAADKAEAAVGNSPAKRLAKAEAERLPVAQRGHVTSITIDRLTGRVYEAANGPSDYRIHPSELHSTLRDGNVARYQDPLDVYHNGRDPAQFPHHDNPLGHAEVRGTNAALHDRELLNQKRGPEDQLPTDFDGLSSILNSPYVPGHGELPCCANCTRVVQGTESTAGHIIDEGAPRVDPLRHADLEQAARDGNPTEPRLVSPEYPETDFMGDDDDVAGPDRGSADSVPPGMIRGDDGLLRRPDDRLDSYRDPDGTWHHVDDPANSVRDKGFRLQRPEGGFLRGDPLVDSAYLYEVQKGDSDSHTMRDSDRADALSDASERRMELQTERNGVRDDLDRLMGEFDVKKRHDLAPEKVAAKIEDLTADVMADESLTPEEMVSKLEALADLESAAERYFTLGTEMVGVSKLLGETAGLDVALSRPGAVLLTPFVGAFDGAGVVDIASYVPPAGAGSPPTLLVVEAKGVGAGLGGSKIARAEQGSPEYLRRTLDMDRNLRRILNEMPEQMRARGIDPDSPEGRALREAVDALRAARDDGTLRVEYKLVHASEKGKVTVTELLLERDGTNVLADVPLPFVADAAAALNNSPAIDGDSDIRNGDDRIDYMDDDDVVPPDASDTPESRTDDTADLGSAMAKIAPVPETADSPGSSDVPDAKAHLLGELDGDIVRDADGEIVSIDNEYIDDYARRLATDRAADYAAAADAAKSQRAADIAAAEGKRSEVEGRLETAKTAKADAIAALKQAAPEDKRAAVQALKRTEAAFNGLREELDRAQRACVRAAGTQNPIGPVMAVTIDRLTGRVYEAANGPSGSRIEVGELHPRLAENVRATGQDLAELARGQKDDQAFPHGDDPLRHAEVRTTNEALHDRDRLGVPADRNAMRSLVHAPVSVGNREHPGMLCCANCTRMISGTESAEGHYRNHDGFEPKDPAAPERRADLAGQLNPDGTQRKPGLVSWDGAPRVDDDADFMGDEDGENHHRKPDFADPEPETPQREVRIELGDNGDVVALHIQLADGQWVVARNDGDEATQPVPARNDAGIREIDNRNALRKLVDDLNAGYQGLNLKYPSGSGLDHLGQTAIRDGVTGGAQLISGPAPTPAQPAPPPVDGPVMGEPPPGAGDPALNVARIGREGLTWYHNREHIPIIGGLLGREADSAGNYHPVYFPDGTEYRPWISDADPNAVRDTVISELRANRMDADEVRDILKELFGNARDPQLRQDLIDDLEYNGLIDTDEARAMEDAPVPPVDPKPEQQGPPPEGETLTEMADRLGIHLRGDGAAEIRRAIDLQSHRLLREIGAIEGLADAARRADEEQTRPYRRADHPADPAQAPDGRALSEPDQRRAIDSDEPRDDYDDFDDEPGASEPRQSHWGDTSAPRPVPFSREVSFLDNDPLGRFLRDLIVAFEGVTSLRDYDRVGNGADRLPEWASFSDDREPGRDEARAREFFEHALRRDQLRDELSGWAAMFGRDLSDLSGDRMDPTLSELRDAARQRAQNLADFIAAAQPILQGDGAEPVGKSYGDQVARVPDADGGPDRLLVVDGPLDREEALARALRDNPELAIDIDNGVLRPDFRTVHADGAGRQFLDPVATPEVQHIRRTVDGAELQVTMMRGEDGQWRPVQPTPEPPPTPRDRADMVREIVDLARQLNLGPAALHPDNIDATIRELHLDNAVRAGQAEALSDYARTMADIETFHLIGDARDQLGTRLGIPAGELTPQRIAEALTDPKQRRGKRQQQFEDLLDGQQRDPSNTAGYSQQLRNVDEAAVKAAQEALIQALSPGNPEALRPKVSKTDPLTGRSKVGPADTGIDPAKLRKLVTRMHRLGAGDHARTALATYADALLRIDPYTDHPAGTRAPDPRTTGDPHIYDRDALHALRDVVGAAEPGANPVDFAAQVADNVARSYGADEPVGPNDPRPQPNRDWARLVGVDVSTADDAKFVEIYEAYRDGKIEKHEGLSPEKLAAEIAAIRAEIRLRTERLEQLKALTDEFYRPVADLPAGDGAAAREHPGPQPDELPAGRRGLPGAPEGGGPNGTPRTQPPGPQPDSGRPDAQVPPERGTDLDDRAEAKLDQTMRKLDEVADELAEPIAALDDLVGPGEPVDPLAMIDNAVERQQKLHDQADERRADQADAALDDTLRELDGLEADVAALESYLRAQRDFEAAQAEIAARFEELAARDAEAAAQRGNDPDADFAVRAADLAALESFLAAQQKFDALRAEVAEAAQVRAEDLDAEALADNQALESYLRAQQEFDAARAEMAARFAAAVERQGSGDGSTTDGVAGAREKDSPGEDGSREQDPSGNDGSRDNGDDPGEPPAASTAPGGPPSKPPSRPPTAPSPEPEEPSQNSSPLDFGMPAAAAELAVPGDAAQTRPVADGVDADGAPQRAYQRRDFLNDVHQFLQELSDLPPSTTADTPPLTPQQAEQVRMLAEALGLGDALTGQRDPLGALAEIADMARARGFLDSALDPDAELGKPMRYPDDYEPLDVDELQDSLDHWRVEGDPQVRAEMAEGLRLAGLEDGARPSLGTEPEPNPQATPLQPSSILPPEDGARQPGSPRIEPAQQAMDRLAARFGVDLTDSGSLDAARYRQLLRAGAVEAFAAAVRHAEAATDPQQRALREAVARRWAARLGLPADPGLVRAADDINRLRAGVTRDAGDMAHLYQMVRNTLDDRVLSMDVEGEKMLVRLVADGPEAWHLEPLARVEPKPFGPTVDKAVEVAPKKNWLRKLWDRFVNRGHYGENPKYPSGSSIDGAGQSMLGHGAGLPLTAVKDSTPNAPGGEYDQLQIKFNPARILKEGVLMWQNRELVPILKHLSSRIADQAGEFLPLRNLDGTEYKPWISDADPELRRQIEQDLRDAGLEHLLEPESLTPAELAARESKQLPESADPVQVSSKGAEVPPVAEPLPPWLREVVDAVNGRLSDATVLEALAHELGVRLTDYSEEGLRKAIAEAEYRLLRRDGVIQALEAAARFFNAEHAQIPFRPANFHSNDPLGAYLKEVVAAKGDQFSFQMLNWRGVNNGGELPNLWTDLADDGNDPTVLAEDARKIFDDALRRAGLRDERSTWAHLAGADLEALVNNLDAEIAKVRDQLDRNIGVLDEFTRRMADFNNSDTGDRLVVDTENGEIAIVDTGAGHEAALARALAEADADFIDRLNRGEVDLEIRVVGIDENGRVHLLEVDAPEVRHLRTEVGGHPVDATMVRDRGEPWRMVELPPKPVEPGAEVAAVPDDTNQPVPEPRSLAEVRADIAEVARRLGIDDPSNLSAQRLDSLLAEQERANQVRARQVEGLVDYARSADAIDNFNALHNVRSALALRFGVTPEALTPEVIARGLADPATRVELHRQRSKNLTEYAELLRALDPTAVHAALDALAPHLGLSRGELSLDADALAEAVSNRAARVELDDLTGPLADYARALAEIDPYAENLVYNPEADPRAIGDDPPVHDRDALDFLREVGADDLSDRSPLPAAPEDAVPGPSRDHARLLGVDLTDADDARVAQVYQWFRDGRIDKHERLTLEQLAQVHEEIRNEIRQRGADIARLRELLNEPFVTDPEIGGADTPALDGPPAPASDGSSPPGTPGLPTSGPGAPVPPGLPAAPEANGDNGTPPADANRMLNADPGTPSADAGVPRPPGALDPTANGADQASSPSTGAEGSRDGADGSRGDDESGDPPAPTPAPGGPPSKPPAHPPTALSPEPEEPSKSSSPRGSELPKPPAELAVPGDADLVQPDSDTPADPPTRAQQRGDLLDDVRQFLRDLSDLPPSAHADAPPLTPEQAEQVRRLADALGLGEALTGQRDPLGALAEIADMARARGFLDSALDPDAELGAPMRYPDDYSPLDLDQLQDGLEHWRVEGDPEVRAEIADDLRRAGLEHGSRPGLGAEPEPHPQAEPLRPSAVLPPDDGAQPGRPRMEPAQQALDRLAARFGVDLTDPGSFDAARYRQLLRAGAVEAFAAAVRHAEAATDPQQRAVREAVVRRWAGRLGLPADPGLVRAADDITRLRGSVSRDAADLAHLDRLARTELDDRMLSVDVEGDRTLVRRVEDGPDRWHLEPVAHPEPTPRAPAAEKVVETPKKNWLRRLWDRVFDRPYLGENPKYPSGSTQDSAGLSMVGHHAGLPLTAVKDSTPNAPGGEYDQLQVKFNPVRILKELIDMWQKRELVPILKHLSSRIADQAGEFLPLRNLDGSEYKPWISDADPELRRQVEQDLRDAGLEHLLEPESLTPEELAARQATELPETGERQPLHAEPERTPEPAEPVPPWLRDVVDAVNQRIADATVLDALAGELGMRITDFSEEGLRKALAEAKYRLLRRDGVIQALEAAARSFNAEHADIAFRPANFFSKDPLGAYLKEVVAARGEKFSFDMLNWRGVNNGGEWVDLWPDLSDDGGSQTIHAEDARKIFDDALRRAGLRDERSTWATLAAADLAALVSNLDAEIAKLRDQLDTNVGVLDEFARRIADFTDSDTGDRLVLDPEHGTIAIVDTGAGHEAALARALADADADFIDRLNRGEVDIQVRIVGVDDQGRVRVSEVDAPQVRQLRGELDGRTVDATMVRDGTGPWRMVETPPRHAASENLPAVADDVNQAVPEPRSLVEVRAEVAEVARRLGIDDPSNLSPEQLNELLAELDRANQVRARQLEGLVDHALSVDAIDNFNALHVARSALALRFDVDAGDLSPELVADHLADPATPGALHRQRAEDLTEYAKLLHALDPAAVDAARDALAPHLGLSRGGLPLDAAAALAEALSNQAARGDRADLAGPLADYVRALAKIDPYAEGLVYKPDTDPRAIGDDPPVHPRDALDFLREVGADDLSDRSPRPPAPEDAVPGPSRDHARLLGADLTDADDEKVAKVYDWFRDGRIDKHERLTLDKLAAVHEQIRAEIRRQAADIARLRALFNEPFVTEPATDDAEAPALGDGPSEGVPASDPNGSPSPSVPGAPVRPGLPAGPATNGDNGTPSADRSGDLPPAENAEPAGSSRPRPPANGHDPSASVESPSIPPVLDPVTDPGDPGIPKDRQPGQGAHRPTAEPDADGSSEAGDGSQRRGADPVAENGADASRPYPRDPSVPPVLDPVTDPGDPGIPKDRQLGQGAHRPEAERDADGTGSPEPVGSDPGDGSGRRPSVDPDSVVGEGDSRRPHGSGTDEVKPGVPADPDSGVDASRSEDSDADPDKGFDPGEQGPPPRLSDGDRPGARRELPGSAYRSHIPHPPHEYEVELEVPVFDAVEWPVPPLELTPEPQEPPEPPRPPLPPLPPCPPDQQDPPCPPEVPEPPRPPVPTEPPLPPLPTEPPLPPVPPQPPLPPVPPQLPVPPQPPVPPVPTEPPWPPQLPVPPVPPGHPEPPPTEPSPTDPPPNEPTVPSWPIQPTPPGGVGMPPLPPWVTQPPNSGLPYPPDGSQPYPPGNGQPYPPGNGQPYPPGNGQPYPPGNGQPYPPGNGQPYPPGNGQPYAPGNGQPYAPGNGQPYAPGSGQPYAPGSGQPYAPGNGQSYAPGNGNVDHGQPGSQQPGTGSPQGGAPMYPPPVMPPAGGQGDSRRPYRPEYQSPTERIVLLVRPYGSGVLAEFDPRSGSLRPAPPGQLGADGLYADLGGVTVIFYRLADRLMVQVGTQPIDLTDAAHIGWERSRQRMTRFTVAVDGRPMGELIYRSLPPELDLGLLIRNVVADPAGRMTIFSDRV